MHERENLEYWETTYKNRVPQSEPSPFARFVDSRVDRQSFIVDIGCGDGRDSEFFVRNGHSVIGIDASRAAVEVAHARTVEYRDVSQFLVRDFSEVFTTDEVRDWVYRLDARRTGPIVFYARFFLHSVAEQVESNLLIWLASVARQNDLTFLEYRTTDDALEDKIFADHFRRYLNPQEFSARALMKGFSSETLAIGRGLAPFGRENPVVCRQVLKLRQ